MEYPKTLQEAIQYYSDEFVSIAAVASLRWPNGAECPHCSAKEPYFLKTQKRWKCSSCRKQFSVKVGTIFEDSAISLTKWLPALWMIVNDKNGVSSWELHRALGVTQKSAWFMLHRLRLALKNTADIDYLKSIKYDQDALKQAIKEGLDDAYSEQKITEALYCASCGAPRPQAGPGAQG